MPVPPPDDGPSAAPAPRAGGRSSRRPGTHAAAADAGSAEQLTLLRARGARTRRPRGAGVVASERPVARVVVDATPHHLDRLFDYLIPARLDAQARPGVRVRVPFNRQTLDGYLVERVDRSDFSGRLLPLASVVSPEPVLSPALLELARAVADRYAGTLADVLQLAIPPRHAAVEAEEPGAEFQDGCGFVPFIAVQSHIHPERSLSSSPGGWEAYRAGPAFLAALAEGRSPRAVWAALPGTWPRALAHAAGATLASGRGAVLIVPSGRDLDRLDAALGEVLGPGRHVALAADAGPAERYRRWLAVARGRVNVVAGTRAAAFAPVDPCGLVAVLDDGDDVHSDPHAPYPHVREILALAAHLRGSAFLVGGHTVTAEGAAFLASGWAQPIIADRATVRAAAPLVRTAADDTELARDAAAGSARLPSLAWRVARDALARGPVLVQVPRRGYLPALACDRCRAAAPCPRCRGPLALDAAHGRPECRWCGHTAAAWRCEACGGVRLRARVVGARRTAEELGRAFPSVPVRTSGREGVLAAVDGLPALVVATPGAEPVADGGYAAALLMDAAVLLARADLRVAEDALRLWMNAAALVRPASDGGTVVVVGEAAHPAVQALLRWDPLGFAERELAERTDLRFPPAARTATLTGTPEAVAAVALRAAETPGAEVLGPVEVEPPPPGTTGTVHRTLVRVPRGQGAELSARLHAAQAARAAGRERGTLRVRVDPLDAG